MTFVNRQGAVPRSVLLLALLLAAALAVLFFLRRNPEPVDYTLGGPLFQIQPEQVEGLLVTHGGAQYRVEKDERGHWGLSGGRRDFLDQDAVANLVNTLTRATGGRLLAGTQPEDRRYDFNGPEAIRLTLLGPDGQTERLAVGTRNPVTGYWYGSGADRPACFPIAAGLREILAAIPASLQLTTLLPALQSDDVQKIALGRDQVTDVLRRFDGRWWLASPADQVWNPGSWYRSYASHYDDRIMQKDDRQWLLASTATVNLLIYECTRVNVSGFIEDQDVARLSPGFQGDHPWRRVVLEGNGLNPDASLGSANRLEIAFDAPLDPTWVPAFRQGNLLRTQPEALNTLGEPRYHLLDSRALVFDPSRADSLVMWREDQVVMRAHRDKRPPRPGERRKLRPSDFWHTDFPTMAQTGMDSIAHHGRARNLMANLENTATWQVFAPTQDPGVLLAKERVRLEFAFAGSARPLEIMFGFLNREALPADGPAPVTPEDSLEPVGIWYPATGQLLQVPGHYLTTARAWAR
jgi:hypothetical protein